MAAGVITLAGALFPAVTSAQTITDWRVGDHDGTTRFVLDMDDMADYKAFTLENPNRLVIDIAGGTWKGPRGQTSTDPLVRKVRHGKPNSDTLRIVLDLNAKASVKDSLFLLPKGDVSAHRLVLDIAASGPVRATTVTKAAIPSKKTSSSVAEAAKSVPLSMAARYPHPKENALPPLSILPGKRPTSLKYQYDANNQAVETASTNMPAPVETRSSAPPVIVIDAGHGGIDPGAIGSSGRYEKDITLRYALALQDELNRRGKYKVVVTRGKDTFINLQDRVEKAKSVDAELFLSLHADSHPDSNTRGLSVYTISEGRSRREAQKLANNTRAKQDVAGINLNHEQKEVQEVLIDMVQRETKNTSASLAD
ncbi:MAG: N-acetylmuramoyl-L-alanine amidase, partial [Rickettsiales bacterium]|nr:N-acetylmuramoyl-L-alanine amidase [Rickettsiales bacterium]